MGGDGSSSCTMVVFCFDITQENTKFVLILAMEIDDFGFHTQ